MSIPTEVYLGLGGTFQEGEKEKMSQKEFFDEHVKYQFMKTENERSWIIKEITSAYEDGFLVNESGCIYELSFVREAPDLKELYD